MKTFKQTVTESESGDELYNLKLSLIDWWKKFGSSAKLEKKDKAKLDKAFNTVLTSLDDAVEIVYEAEPEKI